MTYFPNITFIQLNLLIYWKRDGEYKNKLSMPRQMTKKSLYSDTEEKLQEMYK